MYDVHVVSKRQQHQQQQIHLLIFCVIMFVYVILIRRHTAHTPIDTIGDTQKRIKPIYSLFDSTAQQPHAHTTLELYKMIIINDEMLFHWNALSARVSHSELIEIIAKYETIRKNRQTHHIILIIDEI